MKFASLRSLQAVLAIGSFFLLTAAKGDGCGTSVVVEPPIEPPTPEVCGAGFHIETVCDGPVVIGEEESTTSSSSGGFGAGGAGGVSTTSSTGSSGTTSGAGGFATTGGGPDEPPSPGICYDTCVPDQPACPPGTHSEIVCGDDDMDHGSSSSSSSSSGSSGGSGEEPPYPGDCFNTCVADQCPPGMHSELICGGVEDGSSSSSSSSSGSSSSGGSGEELPYPGDCYNDCVPDQCPIGTIPVTTCVDGCDGMSTCTVTCQPGEYQPD
jgi:hypothetical protein